MGDAALQAKRVRYSLMLNDGNTCPGAASAPVAALAAAQPNEANQASPAELSVALRRAHKPQPLHQPPVDGRSNARITINCVHSDLFPEPTRLATASQAGSDK